MIIAWGTISLCGIQGQTQEVRRGYIHIGQRIIEDLLKGIPAECSLPETHMGL